MGNLALELRRLQVLESTLFAKRSDKEKIGFGQGAQIGKSSPNSPRLEMSKFMKRTNKGMVAFRGLAQIEGLDFSI